MCILDYLWAIHDLGVLVQQTLQVFHHRQKQTVQLFAFAHDLDGLPGGDSVELVHVSEQHLVTTHGQVKVHGLTSAL